MVSAIGHPGEQPPSGHTALSTMAKSSGAPAQAMNTIPTMIKTFILLSSIFPPDRANRSRSSSPQADTIRPAVLWGIRMLGALYGPAVPLEDDVTGIGG